MGRLVVTGASGFLGSNLCRVICTENFFDNVIALTHRVNAMRLEFSTTDTIQIFGEDALVTGEVQLTNKDILINCAYPRAMNGVDVTSGLDYVESVFRLAASSKIKGIINISSQSVYDPQREHPATEDEMPCLTDEYAIGKYCMELLLRNVCKDIPYTNIRLASLIGPGFDVRVPNKMARNAINTGKIKVETNNQKFGYLDVEDAVNGLKLIALLDPLKWRPIYNLGSSKTYSLTTIAETVKEVLSKTHNLDILIEEKNGDAVLNTDLDSSRLISDVGEYQTHSLKESIIRIIEAV